MEKESIKIAYFGTSDFAVPALELMIRNGYKVIAVITQPEKPAGRERITMPSSVKKFAIENKLPVLEPHFLKKDDEFYQHFKNLKPDICVVAAYGKIIPAKYLEIPRLGFLNIHPSLLPKYRGPSPIQAAISNGDEKTGVALIKMDEEIDHGSITAMVEHKLDKDAYYKQIESDLAKIGAELLIETLPRYIDGEIKIKDQNDNQATFTNLIKREDGKISWDQTATKIYNQIRALNPEPGTWTHWNNQIINIKTAEVSLSRESNTSQIITPGKVIKMGKDIVVATTEGHIILREIQLQGGKKMTVGDFANGHSEFIGSVLE